MMNYIKKLISNRKEKKRIKLEEEKRKRENRRKECIEELNVLTNKMTSTPCPIREDENYCFEYCVHFKNGTVSEWFYEGYYHYYVISPKCKLWGAE